MSVYLVCPLCGKFAHLSCFTPDKYSDDIECVEMRSLGRARGFEVSARFSALGDEELMDMISSRCHAILTIIGEEVTKPEDTDIEDELRDEIVELKESVDDYEEEMDGLLAQVNEALSDVYEEFDTLEAALGALIVEYREALEEVEDEDEEEDDEDESDGSEYEEPVKPMTALDREIQLAERELQIGEEEDEF